MSNHPVIQLCPAQKRTFDNLSAGLQVGSIVHLWGGVGRGKTTILKELHKQVGGVHLNMKDFVEASSKNHPLGLEETLYQLLFDALKSHPAVIVDDVLRNLEINIVLPLENDALANQYQLRSKRGVLLYGPPGTGKTTVGRALAHRLKSKFFLIDGTFITGTSDFYNRIHHVFEAAKDNAPSIIFFDDADSIFEDGEERGLYR